MNRQTEREYREAMDGLRFSQGEKERIMKNLMEQQNRDDNRPAKGKRLRRLRAALVAAAVCAALMGTAGAATFAVRQAKINFYDSFDEVQKAREDRLGEDDMDLGVAVYGIYEDLKDFDELTPLDMDYWWNGEQGQTLLEETPGAGDGGWTAKRVFRHEINGQTRLVTKYKAERLSGLNGLWNVWDTTWLEERYTTVPQQMMAERMEVNGQPTNTILIGHFRGQGGTVFNVQYSWNSDVVWGDEDHLTTGLDHHEVYTTADGADATIMTASSHSGKTLFWVSVISGHSRFSMFGTQVELDELHAILDSLSLSKMLEAVPAD